MGVKGLWKILEPVKEIVSVESLRSKVLGVDLAVWVVQAETVTNGEVRGIYLRNLFFKISHLLENGIGVVVVTDGKAPILKAQTIANRLGVNLDRNYKVIQRRRFMKIMAECEELLLSIGITVLKGESEGEASAAKLQLEGKIDGVITTDGDAFLYGARQVYRNVLVTEKYCEMYSMDRIEYELGLCRDDLVGLAILNGCDYNPDGIPGLGHSTVLKYIQDRERVRSVTDELTAWHGQRQDIHDKAEQLSAIVSKPHCSLCKHVGSKKSHNSSGCDLCGVETFCVKGSPAPCDCTKHVAKRLLASPHMLCCTKFIQSCLVRKLPVKEIVNEFFSHKPISLSPSWNMPHCDRFIYFMNDKLQWRKISGAEKFAYIASLHNILQNLTYSKSYPMEPNTLLKFNHILKQRTKDKVPMFELEFTVIDRELRKVLEIDTIYSILDANFVEQLIPEAVAEFNKRQVKATRKKKDTVPIYERYPVKPKPVFDPPKPQSPKKAVLKKAMPSRPKTAKSEYPVTASILTDKMQNLNLNTKFSSSDDDEYVPLAERIARRKANSVSTTSLATDETVSKTSVSKSWSSSSLSSTSSLDDDVRPTLTNHSTVSISRDCTLTNHSTVPVEDNDKQDNVLAENDNDLPQHDSNIQLLPQDFMDEYLDMSRAEILEISHEDRENSAHDTVPQMSDGENSAESTGSQGYAERFSEGPDYHQLTFVTPSKREEGPGLGSVSPEIENTTEPHEDDQEELSNGDDEIVQLDAEEVMLVDGMENQVGLTHEYTDNLVTVLHDIEDDHEEKNNSIAFEDGTNFHRREHDQGIDFVETEVTNDMEIYPLTENNAAHQECHDAESKAIVPRPEPENYVISVDFHSSMEESIVLNAPNQTNVDQDYISLDTPIQRKNDYDPSDLSLILNAELDKDDTAYTPLPGIGTSKDHVLVDDTFSPESDNFPSFSPNSPLKPISRDKQTEIAKEKVRVDQRLFFNDISVAPTKPDDLGSVGNPIVIPSDNIVGLNERSEIVDIPDDYSLVAAMDDSLLIDAAFDDTNTSLPLPHISSDKEPLDLSLSLPLPSVPHCPSFIPSDFSPAPPMMILNPCRTPDTSFLDNQLSVTSPVWHKKPLSDISNITSTPLSKEEKLREVKTVAAVLDPLPDIHTTDENFIVNITELLENTCVE